MPSALEDRCRQLVAELGLGRAEDVVSVEALSGGVASDIARVRLRGREICVKFALPRLKVAEEWRAPVHRNAAEYAWLELASALFPGSGVKLYGRSERLHGFAMEYLAGRDVRLWKSELLAEAPDRGEAQAVGDMLGRIHAASARPGFDRRPFENRDDFRALRIEPYLTFTAGRHPALAAALTGVADMLYDSSQVLVHGDVSPKNILFRAGAPILLDAECATMGDASFDPAFCLNHLALK
ncbi:MAG: aminoglycoside phosphotransferase family protein, partial [Alphaproteobacteria bacterium]